MLILVVIAVFSFRLLFEYHDMPKPYMTVKATGYQWYWGYEYPDQKIPENPIDDHEKGLQNKDSSPDGDNHEQARQKVAF